MRGARGMAAQQENPAGTITDSPLNAPTLNRDQGRALPLVTRYTLPPEKYAKARRLNQIGYVGRMIAPVYQILILFLILGGGWSAKFRNFAERVSSNWLVQGVIYAAVALFFVSLLMLPLDAAEHSVYRHYGLSIQGWDSWLWDKVKELMVTIIVGSVVVWGVVAAIRRSPRKWWLWAWAGAVVFSAVLVFLAPVVIDPLFNKFEPLAEHDAPLTQALERVVDRAGLTIPVDRMYWMAASEKVRTMNAYVTGLGASKRVVVWDTTIANATTPEILFVFGHELGHYVLGHIPKQLGILAAIFLVSVLYGIQRVDGVAGETRGGVGDSRRGRFSGVAVVFGGAAGVDVFVHAAAECGVAALRASGRSVWARNNARTDAGFGRSGGAVVSVAGGDEFGGSGAGAVGDFLVLRSSVDWGPDSIFAGV